MKPSPLITALLRQSSATQECYEAARDAGDAVLMAELRRHGLVLMSALAAAAKQLTGAEAAS